MLLDELSTTPTASLVQTQTANDGSVAREGERIIFAPQVTLSHQGRINAALMAILLGTLPTAASMAIATAWIKTRNRRGIPEVRMRAATGSLAQILLRFTRTYIFFSLTS
jgi:hypothetical protein